MVKDKYIQGKRFLSCGKKLKITPAEEAYLLKYMAIKPLPNKQYVPYFIVGVQYFAISGCEFDTKEEAFWHCWMFVKALLKVGP